MNGVNKDSVKSKFEITFERTFENCFCLFMSLLIMAPFNNNEKLSELVKLYPCLYNKQEKDFKKEDIKQRTWNEIAKKLNISNEKEIFILRLRIAKANDARRRARPLHAILFYERIFFSCLAIT